MTNETKVQRKKGEPSHGKSDLDRLKEMTEEEIENNAKDDEDLPLQSDDDLKRFIRVVPKKD
jgi:hypothetical protein